jgi:hypothetical protein
VSGVSAAVWVLDTALVAVSGAVAAGNVGTGGCDVAAAVGGSGCERSGWGVVSRLGSECRRLRRAGGCFEGRDEAVVTVVDDVVDVDGGCAGDVSSDVAGSGGNGGLVVGSSKGAVCITASSVAVGVVWDAVSMVVGPSLVVQASRSAVLPRSSPSFSPFSYPSRLPSSSVAILEFLIVL